MTNRLPIYDIERELVARLRTDRRLILSAPTGSGKSTQVPQILLRNNFLEAGQVIILQPRRLAARLLAARVAEELGVPLGQEVGYQIRFENVTSAKTKIRFVTEGILLRQMQADPKLRGVSAIIFDEFHERHLYGDITLARSLDLQEQHRPDLNLVVMSATLDAGILTEYLSQRRNIVEGSAHETQAPPPAGSGGVSPPVHSSGCSVLVSEGRTYPVAIEYAEKPAYADQRPIWEQAADAFSHYVHHGGRGRCARIHAGWL